MESHIRLLRQSHVQNHLDPQSKEKGVFHHEGREEHEG